MSNKSLPYCCEHGLKEEVIALLAKGEDVNQRDQSSRYPLHYAAIGGYVEIVAMLLEHGAIVNCATPRGATPLHYASRGGRIECIQLLIDHKADVNCKDSSGSTPLHTALVCNETKCAIALIETFHADINLTNSDGSTPLHLASARGLVQVIILLLENGAKFDQRDSKENSPFISLPINLNEDKKEQKVENTIVQDISKLFDINKNKEFSGVEEDSMNIDNQDNSTDKLYSDITFLVENQKVYAHKCIVEIRCPNFMNSIKSQLLAAAAAAAVATEVEIKDTTFKLFLSFIEWIYTGSIEKFDSSASKSVDLSFQFSVLLLAEKYDCKSLISYCKEFISKNIGESNVGSIWSIIKKLPSSIRTNPSISGLIRDCLITMVKGWNIFISSKTFSNDITNNDVIEIIKSLSPYITETQISEIKQGRNTNANTNQSKTPAKSGRSSIATTNPSNTQTPQPQTPITQKTSQQSHATPKLTVGLNNNNNSINNNNSNNSNDISMNEKNSTICKGIISGMFKKKTTVAFQRPVDPQAEGIPDYFDIIKHPMDLSTIKNKLDSNKYANIKEFAADVRLMFENAMTYNADSSPIWKHAKTLLTAFDQKFVQTFPNEKIPLYKPPTPIPIPQPTQSNNNNNNNNNNSNSSNNINNNINNTPATDKKRKMENEHVRVKEDTASAQPSNSNNNYTNGENASNNNNKNNNNNLLSTTTSTQSQQKKYSDEERRNLMEKINELEADDIQEVLGIIDQNAIKQADESLEIDMYQIDDKNLSQVESFINECFKKQKQE